MGDGDPLELTGVFDASDAPTQALPEGVPGAPAQLLHVGRYRIVEVLGRGEFGLVYLAHDDQLQRMVAIKVPHARLISQSVRAEAYLFEARTVARLDHPHIVPVFDVGVAEGCPCFIVSKYIDGTDLAAQLKQGRLTVQQAAELTATVAEALHYAHKQGLVHRDVKPRNILLDKSGKPYVADFGLALREQDIGTGPQFAGTPAYMSPEQARSEGHRVDGRSDVFSLGIVFYELLVGRRPFIADSTHDILELISNYEARPPRQSDESIPKELDRICLKALAKRASDRYSTAKDMADDLRHFLTMQAGSTPAPVSVVTDPLEEPSGRHGSSRATAAASHTAGSRAIQIVPKGLRSFDAHDSDFFLELVPGPRDREGLPESIRFWKSRIEEPDADDTFPVGLICGPSGCGKSSLVKAGLLPHLGESVLVVYVEATALETERRLLNGLRKRCPALPERLNLKESLAALRRGVGLPTGKKVLLVLDQFEQWLHARAGEPNTELAQALRQCDGGRLQGLVLVRDDFWMAVIRFMRELEVPILDGQNSAVVDLFPVRHAERILGAFGRAFGILPQGEAAISRDQQEFLKQAALGLAREGKVIPVRLALFAEMMKNKPWTPAALSEVGGTEGVGTTFLDETFSAQSAPPEHRYHQKAAREVLTGLLPESGTDIKGHMRSYDELLETSGYKARPADFDELIRILDGELRLITPTDLEGKERGGDSAVQLQTGHKYYQLTHDYLVHSLRDWLTRKQRETMPGRMQIRLQERTALWTSRREHQQLPSFLEWLWILRHTERSAWSAANAAMMRAAGRRHLRRIGLAMALFVVIGAGVVVTGHLVRQHERASKISGLVDDLQQVRIEHLPQVLSALEPDRSIWEERVRAVADSPETPPAARARAHLALAAGSAERVPPLVDRMLECDADEQTVIRQELSRWKPEVTREAWHRVQSGKLRPEQTIRAAALLAGYSPDAEAWNSFAPAAVDALVDGDPFFAKAWIDDLYPVRTRLVSRLFEVCTGPESGGNQRDLAASIIARFGSSDRSFPETARLVELSFVPDVTVRQRLNGLLSQRRGEVLQHLAPEVDRPLEANPAPEYQAVVRRKAIAVEMAQRLGQDGPFWRHLDDEADPRLRTILIDDFANAALNWDDIRARLGDGSARVRQAVILGMPQRLRTFVEQDRAAALAQLLEMFRRDQDAGVHSAAEYVLRTSGSAEALDAALDQLARSNAQVGNWSILPNRLCMIAVRSRDIDHPFEISATEITVRQFREFRPDYVPAVAVTSSDDCPMSRIDLFSALQFCRWLSERDPGFDKEMPVYPPVETIGAGLLLAPDYLERAGFRLPTTWEWEYATRAGSQTARFFGDADEHLSRYAWWVENSQERLWPVGSKRPNPFGLFDTFGNVHEWCHEPASPFDSARQPMRGGDYRTTQRFLNVTVASPTLTTTALSTMGFRVVRIKPRKT